MDELMKSEFLSPLRTEDGGDSSATLIEPLVYYSEILGRAITIPAGFETDFASVPRLPFVYTLFGGIARKAAVVHDYLYRKSGVSRRQADMVFYEAMKATGQWWWRRAIMWVGLRAFGWTAYHPAEDKPKEGPS